MNIRAEISYLLKEYSSVAFIFAGLIFYLTAILFLMTLESPIFVVCSYIGTTLFVGGILAKLGMSPATWKSKAGLSVVIFFISALCFTTSVVSLFVSVKMTYTILGKMPFGGPSQPNPSVFGYGYPFAVEPEISEFGNVNLDFHRPFAYLAMPLIEVGSALFILAIVFAWLGKAI